MKNLYISIIAAITMTLTANAKGFDIEKSVSYAHEKIVATLNELNDDNGGAPNYSRVPWHVLKGGKKWDCQEIKRENWTCGFWAGCLWYDYMLTGENREAAERYSLALDTLTHQPIYDHDLGFEIYCSYGPAIKSTDKQVYKDAVVRAADKLCELYNPKVGTLLSWPRNVGMFGGHNTIMDNMINLETLFAATSISGNRRYADIAVSHAVTTMRNHFRPDFTSYHVAVYDTLTGNFIHGKQHQGYADETMWARGQSWAIYGYTMVYRETKDPLFLDWAQKVTDVYLDRLPKDKVPYWDFNDPKIPNSYRDVSTACVVASALIELQQYVSPEKQRHYLSMAEEMLHSISKKYISGNDNSAILSHSVGNLPAGTEIDASLIYADYYYLEALYRLKKYQVKEKSCGHTV